MLYVYGILDAPCLGTATIRGHSGERVYPISSGELAVAVSDLRRAEIEPSEESVWCHERVLETLMERHAVLPARFGLIAIADRLLAILRDRRKELLQNLELVGGKAEMALRLSRGRVDPVSSLQVKPASARKAALGTAYLEARMEGLHRSEEMKDWARDAEHAVRSRLDRFSADSIWDIAEGQALSVKASYLARREEIPVFVQAVEEISRSHVDIRVTCTGPWAPYSFVNVQAMAGGCS